MFSRAFGDEPAAPATGSSKGSRVSGAGGVSKPPDEGWDGKPNFIDYLFRLLK